MVIYCYYNSDTSKQVMPQITLGELLQKGGLPPNTCGVSV